MGAIAASFNDKSEPKSVISNGVKINGEKYMTIEASDDSLKAKKVRCASQHSSPTILYPLSSPSLHLLNTPPKNTLTHTSRAKKAS